MQSTKQLTRLDKRFVWHPFTQMREWHPDQTVVIASARGPYLIDTEGRKYLDGVSSLWCNVHGHRVPEIDRAVKKQLGRVAHSTFLGLSNIPAILLAKELVRIAPRGLKKVFYSDSGSEAVEIALKMAYQYWQNRGLNKKKFFLRLTNAYHGDTVGSVSVGGIGLFHKMFRSLLFKTFSAEGPDRAYEKFEGTDEEYADVCAARVEHVLKRHAQKVAALVMEPLIQGAAGMITHPRGYLKRLRRLTRKYDVLLIADEVATGFGRTGRMFACQHENVSPDILCAAKGLSGGYMPLAATLVTDTIYRAFLGPYREFKAFFHGHTYTANPLACAAALASLGLFKKNRVLQKARKLIACFTKELASFRGLKHVGNVRQCGLMAGIDLVKDEKTGAPFPLEEKMGIKVCYEARKSGIMVRPLGDVIVLMPSFAFSTLQVRELCQTIQKIIAVI